MTSYCGVFGCTNNAKTDPHLSFFSLPKDDRRREKWIELMDRNDLMNVKNPRHLVCSVHFTKDMLKNKRLKPDAVPSLNMLALLCRSSSKENVETYVDEMVQESYNLNSIQKQANIESGDNSKKDDEIRSASCQTPVYEELWVVRKKLCRCCHSDGGAFSSLLTMTEGDTYGDLLQTYFNIQLCPVSKDEFALSAICALCAARLRDARAFSAQAHAAEERFTRFYKQNRIRALVKEVEVREDVPKTNIGVNVKLKTANSNLDNPDSSIEKLAPTVNKFKKRQVRRLPLFRLSPSDYERVGNLFKCTRCNKMFRRERITKHVKLTHLKLPLFNCPHCDKTFVDLFQFTKHKLDEHSIDDRIKCNVCDWLTYRTKTELKKHINESHMLGEKLTCPDCDYVSFSPGNFRRHIVKHSTVKEHHCKYCKKKFLRKKSLNEHARIHTEDKRKK